MKTHDHYMKQGANEPSNTQHSLKDHNIGQVDVSTYKYRI